MNVVNVDTNTKEFEIGIRAENDATKVLFDLSELVSTYGSGNATLMVKRPRASFLTPEDADPAYPVVVEQEGSTATWTVSDTDLLYHGYGKAEIFWYVGNTLAKSIVYRTNILPDIGATTTTPPDAYSTWVENLTNLGATTVAAASVATQAAEASYKVVPTNTITANGIATYDNASNVPMASVVSTIEAVQATGTPTPSSPLAISGWTGANVEVRGKNILNESGLLAVPSWTKSGNTYTGLSGYLQNFVFWSNPNGYTGQVTVSLKYHTTENLSYRAGYIAIFYTDGTASSVELVGTTSTYRTLTSTAGKVVDNIKFTYSNSIQMVIDELMIELGSSATAYEAPNSNTYAISWADDVGTVYGGYFDPCKGTLTRTWDSVNLGSFSYGYTSGYFYSGIASKAVGNYNIKTSIYATASQPSASSMGDYEIKGNASNYNIYIKDSRYTDGASLKAALDGVYAVFELATPVTYTIDTTTIYSVKGYNTVWTNCGDVTNVTYRYDLTDYIARAYPHDTASGNAVAITDGADDLAVRDLIVNIEPQQASGTPSPSNVLPITGWQNATVTRCGKNIYSGNSANYAFSSGKIVSGSSYRCIWQRVKAGETYTVSRKTADTARFQVTSTVNEPAVDEPIDLNYIANNSGTSITYTVPSGYNYIFVYLSNSGETIDTDNYQIEVGSTATTYEAYNGTTYTIDLDGTIYGGQLDVTTGVLTVTHGIVDLGDLTWVSTSDSYLYRTTVTGMKSPTTGSERINGMLCSEYAPSASTNLSNISDLSYMRYLAGSSTYLYVKDSNQATVSDFQSAVDGVQFYYPLETALTVQLSPTEVTTLLGNNTIFADCGSVELLDYHADTTLYIAKLTGSTDTDMIADVNIASGKYFMVGNQLYKSTTAITAGETIAVGTNCTKTDLATALNALQ